LKERPAEEAAHRVAERASGSKRAIKKPPAAPGEASASPTNAALAEPPAEAPKKKPAEKKPAAKKAPAKKAPAPPAEPEDSGEGEPEEPQGA
jgi:hypothetical protein